MHPSGKLPAHDFASDAEWFEQMFTPEPTSGCWLWTAGISGRTGAGPAKRRPTISYRGKRCDVGSRVSHLIYKGPIPEGLFVLHKCDVPLCVNPDHLWLGNNSDNMRDMVAKGRAPSRKNTGARPPLRAKLTEDIVRAIRADLRPSDKVADAYSISRSTINRIRARKIWKLV